MARDWLLVETLGAEPTVVAEGRDVKNLIPIAQFLRRSPDLAAIQTAITETVQTGQSMASITPKNNRVIRTEPVQMSDGRVHGVQVWIGSASAEPPERPVPGPLIWDLTLGVATDTPESLANRGRNPDTEGTHGRAFAEDLPTRDLSPGETTVVALSIRPEAGQTLCSSWDVTDWQGNPVRVGFVARSDWEPTVSGREHLIARGMNWRCDPTGPSRPPDVLARQVLQAFTQPGTYRALADLDDWRLLKWLDEPCPLCDCQDNPAMPRAHPDDAAVIDRMTTEFATGPTAGVLRLPQDGGGWVPLHVTVNRVELENGFAGLVALRAPTDDELAAAAPPADTDDEAPAS